MRPLQVLMATGEEQDAEAVFRPAIEQGGHFFKIMNPWGSEEEFLEEVKRGKYDVIMFTNLCFPLDLAIRLIAPCRNAGNTNVIVVSSCVDEEIISRALREGAVAFYPLPFPYKHILGAVEAAAEGAVIIKR